jgi:hypothetical protein
MVTAQVLRAMQGANQGGQMLRQGPNIVSPGSLLALWRIVTHIRSVDGSPCHDPADAPAGWPQARLASFMPVREPCLLVVYSDAAVPPLTSRHHPAPGAGVTCTNRYHAY